jgi:hypothetical protein
VDKRFVFAQKERALRYDIAAMLALEDASGGKPTGAIVASLQQWSFTSLVLLLWAGFRWEDKNLTQATVRKALDAYVLEHGSNVRQLRKDITDAIEASAWYKQIDTAPDDDEEGVAIP